MASAIDYSRTQRTLLLIDLTPLLHLQNPTSYLNSILTSSKIILNNSSSSSLFSFKFFFSSSKLPIKPSLSLSFDRSLTTLDSLSKALDSLPDSISRSGSSSDSPNCASPRANHVASALRQILHDYAWDYQLELAEDDSKLVSEGTLNFGTVPVVGRSNLVVLLTPFCKNLKELAEFIDLDLSDENLVNSDVFCEMFNGFFDGVNDAFVSNDIHLSWVDVRFELGFETKIEIDEKLKFLEKGVRGLNWGFCSTDSIVLGSALVPFGLIYPMIGVPSNRFNCDDCSKKVGVQLSLQINDINGKVLECKCCDLNLIDLKMKSMQGLEFLNSQTESDDREKTSFWEQFGDGNTKFLINSVQRYDEHMKIEGRISDIILVNGISREFDSDKKISSGMRDFFADRVLNTVIMEMGSTQRKYVPIWPILLSYLFEHRYWAVVTISNGNGKSFMGILKPFTVQLAFLFIVDGKFCPQNTISSIGMLTFNGIPKQDLVQEEDRKKKDKRKSSFYKDLTWSSFCKTAFEQTKIDMGKIYLASECHNSKKLKFLNCWMKQMTKSKCGSLILPDGSNPDQQNPKETEEIIIELQQSNELAVPSSVSVGEEELTEASRIQDETALDFCSETLETFFSNLSKKVRDGLESEGVDLGALAERLVSSAIYWLYKKRENDAKVNIEDNGCTVADELLKLLLREPGDLAKRHNNNDTSLPESDSRSNETIAREYELQILFRMEILRSEIATSVEESTKQKFVKQICLLLEQIQCRLEGGFFGEWSLDNYVERIMKTRYSHTLRDIVDKIYKKMDLIPFVEEDETPNFLLNSEDSNHSCREKTVTDENKETDDNNDSEEQIQEAHVHKLTEAQNRRERDRRFKSFTSWMPDLQRVWAPKPVKAVKGESSEKPSKKKSRRGTRFDKVCETPMTENKRSRLRESSSPYNPVSKALFQNDS